jgi:outer membrane protein assembly factor BamB
MALGLKSISKKRRGHLEKEWDFNSHSKLSTPVIIHDIDKDGEEEIIFGTKNGKVFVLDQKSKLKWFYDCNEKVTEEESMFMDTENISSIHSKITIDDISGKGNNHLLFGTELGFVYALSSKGKVLFKYKTKGAIRGSVAAGSLEGKNQKNIVFGTSEGKLIALDTKGKMLWEFDTKSPIQSTPLVTSNVKPRVIFGCDDGTIYCLNEKGDMVWNYKTNGKIFAQVTEAQLMKNDRLFYIIGSSDNYLYILDDAGELFAKYQTEGAIISKAVVSDINNDRKPEIVFGSCDNSVYVLTNTGDLIWSYETDFWIGTEPLITDVDKDGKKEVAIGSYDHNVYILDSEGNYLLNYMPGLSSVVHQSGHNSDIITSEPGKVVGKKIWQYKTEGIIVGCNLLRKNNSIIVSTKKGLVSCIKHIQ